MPHIWLFAATWLTGHLAAGLVLRGSLRALLPFAALTMVPGFVLGTALAAAFMDPYAEWVAGGRRWRSAAFSALGALVFATALAVASERFF